MSFNNKNLTQGGQVAFYWVRMFLQVNSIIFRYLIIGFFAIGIFSFLMINSSRMDALKMGYYYYSAKIAQPFGSKSSISIKLKDYSFKAKASDIVNNVEFIQAGEYLKNQIIIAAAIGFIVTIIIAWFAYRYLGKKGKNQSEDDYVSGRKFEASSSKVAKQMKKEKIDSDIIISGLPIVKNSEIQNILMHGTVGAGKSTLINQYIQQIKLRSASKKGNKIIVYDKGNSLVSKFYDPEKDYILNPLDDRCVNWDLWDECLTKPDFDMFASSLIPEQGNDPFWYNAPRTVLSSIGFEMKGANPTYKKFLYNLLVANTDQMRRLLKNTESENFVSGKAEKTTESIRGIIGTFAKSLMYMQGIEKGNRRKFIIRDWIKNENDNGVLWITSNGSHHESIKSLITAWLSVAINSLFGLGEDIDRRVWFVIDELYSLNKLSILNSMLAEGRKFGACFLLGSQNLAQLEESYGQKGATGILDLVNTRYFFRSPSYTVAKRVSDEIGHTRYKVFNEQYAYGSVEVRDGVSFSKKEEEKTIVSADDIMQLPNLECYVTYPARIPVTLLKSKWINYPEVAKGFIPREVDARIVENEIDSIELMAKNLKKNKPNDESGGREQYSTGEVNLKTNSKNLLQDPLKKEPAKVVEVANREEININETHNKGDEFSL